MSINNNNNNNIDLEKQSVDQHSDSHIARITTSGHENEIIHIGEQKVYKRELMAAFGGDFQPGLHAPPSRKFANPSPLGLCGFALTTFVLSLVNVQARGVTNASGVIGLAYFYGGVIQLLAGMWEIVVENPFGATALSSYGGFWLSWAALNTESFGISAAYTDADDFNNVVGFFLLGWFFFTFIMLMMTLKSTIAFFSLFFFLDITFLFLTIEHLGHSPVCGKIGGYFGIITAVIAWYNAYAGIANKENSYFVPRPIFMPGAVLPSKSD